MQNKLQLGFLIRVQYIKNLAKLFLFFGNEYKISICAFQSFWEYIDDNLLKAKNYVNLTISL